MNNESSSTPVPGSFRDPSGFLFRRDGELYRQVNQRYKTDYDLLMSSGLYESLVENKLLVSHREVEDACAIPDMCYRTIKPGFIDFISYPYEWSFSQLKDAALATLEIQKAALEHGMSLKDASAYNIQFQGGKPLLIDTLSFEKYREGEPWVAYRQYCQHFLAPLALMSYTDIRLSQLLRTNIDGIPLDLASKLLPGKTKLNMSLSLHIHVHAKSQQKYADGGDEKKRQLAGKGVSKHALSGMIDNLESTTRKLEWKQAQTEWGEYYSATNYSDDAQKAKAEIIKCFIESVDPSSVWDMGGNTGLFSRIASDMGIPAISFDIDPVAVEKNYLEMRKRGEKNILPLLNDLTNPSPGLGWHHSERDSLVGRGPTDMAFALALIHHLAISNNLPFTHIAGFFADICNTLIIEFVPKSDSQVKRLLTTREDIFDRYNIEGFEEDFGRFFKILEKKSVKESERVMYLMEKK